MTEAVLGIGEALARARQEQGLEVADVAQSLKFMPRQIESLDAERFEALPGPTIARGMVRTYARFLKLDPEPLLERMTGRVGVPDATPQLAARFRQPVPFSDSGRRSTFLYFGLSIGVLAVAAVVLYQWRHEHAAPELVAAAPKEAPADAAPKEAPTVGEDPARAEPPAAASEAARRQEPAPAPAKAAAAQDDTTLKSVTGVNRLVLLCEEEAWIEVTDGAGRLLVSSLNPAGTERVIRGRPPFNLVIGNAQHVKVSYNDRAVDLQPHVKVEVARLVLK